MILGYSFWNEQNAPIVGEAQADSEKAYGDLYQECIDVVRTVDKKHLIICEQIFAQQNQDGGYRHTNFPAFPPLKEQNLMYEYHCYEPMEYTYQDKSASQQKFPIKWDDPDIISGAGLYVHKQNQSVTHITGQTINSGWKTVESDVFTADNKTVAGSPLFFFNGTAIDGKMLTFQWVEIWDVTENKRVYRCCFDSVNSVKTYFSYDANSRSYNGGLCFTNMTGYMMVQNDRVEIVELTDGHMYKVVTSVCGDGLPADCTLNVGLRFWGSHVGKALRNNIEALRVYHKPYVEYRDKNNIPVFCGEWGAYYDCYSEGLNSKQWAEEMLSVFKELEMQFTVHTPFAMYSKNIQPWHYASGTTSWGGPEYTILEDAFRKVLPTI